jgi:hypothetical protein
MIRRIFMALPALLPQPPFRRPHLRAEAVGGRFPDASLFRVGSGLAGAARLRREEKAARTLRPRPRLSRLPHGSTFHVIYDAEAVRWSGTLTIPAPRSGIFKESVVSADDSALFALLQRLDRKFRGLEEEPAHESPTVPQVGDALPA